MKKVKRIISLFLVAVMAMGLMAGCGNNEEKPVTLTWYFLGDTAQSGNAEVYKTASDMVYEKLGFYVDFKPFDYSTYAQKIQMVIAGGEDWDICWTSNWSNDYASNVANGAFAEIDELLNEAPALRDSIDSKIWEGTKIGGKLYGIPVQQIMARRANLEIPTVFYEKYNDTLQNVETYTDMDAFMKAYGKDYPNHGTVNFNLQNLNYDWNFDDIVSTGFPAVVAFEDDSERIEVFNQYETETYRNAVVLRREWTKNGYTRKGSDGNAQASSKKPEDEPFVVNSYSPGYEIERAMQTGYPVTSLFVSDAYLSSAGINATLHGINKRSKHKVEAIKFLEYVNTDKDIINLLVYGIEGKHYEKIDENTVRRIENSGYRADDWVMGNVFNTYVLEGQPEDKHVLTKEINDTAKASRLLGFVPNLDPIKVEIANCKSVLNEYTETLEGGFAEDPIAYLDEMNAKFKTAGVDKVIAELQSQIDAWQATK